MLRLFSNRCFSLATISSSEPRLATFCCSSNLTSAKSISNFWHVSTSRCLSTAASKSRDDESVIVYKGRLEKDIFRVKIFSMTTSVFGLAFQPILFSQASSLPVVIATCTIAGFFTFVNPILLNQLAKRHVNTVTYNEKKDQYVAHTTTFFFKEKLIPIEPGEAKYPEVGGIFTSLEVRGIPLMVEMDAFDKKHLVRLLGYDKPMDIKHEQITDLIKEAEERLKSKDAERKKLDQKSSEEVSQQRSSTRM